MDLTVDLICWRLSQPAQELVALFATLSPDECARANAFRFRHHRDQWIAARGGLRRVLGKRLGIHPKDLNFSYGPSGKPYLNGTLRFNLSHAGGWGVVALCDGAEPGLDIEVETPIDLAVAKHHFAKEECEALWSLPARDRRSGFFRCWTRKEAVLKATGQGLSMPLSDFAVSISPDAAQLLRIKGDDPEAWALRQLPAGPGMAAALAIRTDGRALRLRYSPQWPGMGHIAINPVLRNIRGSGLDLGLDGCGSHG